ncbi:MAG: 4-(cytidine 5'-diphospho)-2-C-methyl-D-erythritol kinase [Eubacteriales bacterium]|nr:4-(cytidine 5'-diphospho)-2-C-methyl-D-erythritol kinase [Eubacteriales bacterium]
MDSIRLKARAKINLGLDVIGRRENGYHDVRMVMQTVGLYDRIIMTRILGEDIRIKTNIGFLPVNENNLVYKAIMLMKNKYNLEGGIEVDLNKFIPVAAGMAGGSSDAASALFGMNRLYELNVPMKELMNIGVEIGADVPYCLMRGTALAEGIGEKLTRLPDMPFCHILIAKPPVNVSTKLVYENLDSTEVESHPDIDGIIEAIKLKDVALVASRMGNVLESVTVPLYPVIDSIKKDMIEHGAINAMMSGSGPTVFGIFPDEQSMVSCQQFLRQKGEARQVYTTETFIP